jgi:transcriptional regulator of arginine metabolism
MLDSLGEPVGILGTLAGDDTIFIAPTDLNRIDEITQSIRDLLGIKKD